MSIQLTSPFSYQSGCIGRVPKYLIFKVPFCVVQQFCLSVGSRGCVSTFSDTGFYFCLTVQCNISFYRTLVKEKAVFHKHKQSCKGRQKPKMPERSSVLCFTKHQGLWELQCIQLDQYYWCETKATKHLSSW